MLLFPALMAFLLVVVALIGWVNWTIVMAMVAVLVAVAVSAGRRPLVSSSGRTIRITYQGRHMNAQHKLWLVLLAFAAAVFFFLMAALSVSISDVDLVPAGLTALAAGFLIKTMP